VVLHLSHRGEAARLADGRAPATSNLVRLHLKRGAGDGATIVFALGRAIVATALVVLERGHVGDDGATAAVVAASNCHARHCTRMGPHAQKRLSCQIV